MPISVSYQSQVCALFPKSTQHNDDGDVDDDGDDDGMMLGGKDRWLGVKAAITWKLLRNQ